MWGFFSSVLLPPNQLPNSPAPHNLVLREGARPSEQEPDELIKTVFTFINFMLLTALKPNKFFSLR
jgi:hypothetical protein